MHYCSWPFLAILSPIIIKLPASVVSVQSSRFNRYDTAYQVYVYYDCRQHYRIASVILLYTFTSFDLIQVDVVVVHLDDIEDYYIILSGLTPDGCMK